MATQSTLHYTRGNLNTPKAFTPTEGVTSVPVAGNSKINISPRGCDKLMTGSYQKEGVQFNV